VCTYFSG